MIDIALRMYAVGVMFGLVAGFFELSDFR